MRLVTLLILLSPFALSLSALKKTMNDRSLGPLAAASPPGGGMLLQSAAQQKEYDVPGAVEFHVYLTAIPGKEQVLERFFREEFYPAVRHQPGFVSSELLRKPNSGEYLLRHTFRSEELRMKWTSSPERQKVWPALTALTTKATWAAYGVVYPPRK